MQKTASRISPWLPQLQQPILEHLHSFSHPLAKKLAGSIRKALEFQPDKAEQVWLEKILERQNKSFELKTPILRRKLPEDRNLVETLHSFETETSTVGQSARRASSAPRKGFMIFSLVRALLPHRGLELGTCVGLSGCYIGAAQTLNGHGTLETIDSSGSFIQTAEENFKALGLSPVIRAHHGLFTDVLPLLLSKGFLFDFIYLDGHHLKQPTLDYFETILDASSDPAVFLLDDIRWSTGMHEAWEILCAHPRVQLSIDMLRMGILVTGKAGMQKKAVQFLKPAGDSLP